MRPESVFTQRSDFCPHPENWTAIDAESTEREVMELVAALVRALQPELAVETGTAFGHTAQAIGEALRRNGHGWLVTIERMQPRASEAEERCAQLPVKVVWGNSLEWEPDAPIQFAWLDSGEKARDLELRRFLPFMARGAIIGVHDTAPHRGVHALLGPLVAEGLVRGIQMHTPRGVTLLEVLGDGARCGS